MSASSPRHCAACQSPLPPHSRFCGRCGAAAAPSCVRCGQALEVGSRFCSACGAPTGSSAPSPPSTPVTPSGSWVVPASVAPRSAFCVACGVSLGGFPTGALCDACAAVKSVCGECRKISDRERRVCECRTLLSLPRDFSLGTDEYEYAGDRQAMNALRSTKVATKLADYIAHKLGKPFIEGQFIGSAIRVSEEQFPHIHRLAELAAMALCVPKLPQIYISGDRFWNSDTYGTGTDSFIVLGSSLARSLSEAELLFVIAKELGHAKSGHAMYRTVAQIVAGSHNNNLMAGGLLGFLDVKRLVALPLELPLMSWLRQSEITADSAGLLVVGDVEIARKTLVLMSLRAPDLYKQINFDAWLKQQDELDGKVSSLNEFVSQSSPFVSRRVRFLEEYARSPAFTEVRARMARSNDMRTVLQAIDGHKAGGQTRSTGSSAAPSAPDVVLSTPAALSASATRPASPPPSALASPLVSDADTIRGRCPKCNGAYSVARAKLPAEGKVHLKCKGCASTFPVQR